MRKQWVIFAACGWIAAAILALWFGAVRDRLRHSEEETPQPEPRAKSTAELLVGKWKQVRNTLRGLPEGYRSTMEFTTDRRVVLWFDNPLEDSAREETGVYRLEGNTLWLHLDPPANEPRVRTLAIETVTENRVVTVGWVSGNERQVFEDERAPNEPNEPR